MRWERWGGAALFALTCAAYLPALRGGFVWDDDDYVEKNETLRTRDGLRQIWTEPGATAQYYPLTYTTFWIEYQLWGLRPAGYHAVNVVLHALNAVLLRRLLRGLGVPGAGWVAAVFALHPVHVESVAWITERKNVLSGLFFLLSASAWFRARGTAPTGEEASARGSRRLYAAALSAYVAALLSKTAAAPLPGALLLVTWWQQAAGRWPARRRTRDAATIAPFLLAGLAAGAMTLWMERTHVGAEGEDWSHGPADRLLLAGRIAWFYAVKLFCPTGLSFVYHRWSIDAADARAYVYPLGAAALLLAAWGIRRRVGREPLVALLYFGGMLLPVMGLFDVYYMRYSFVADHFQYLPSIGLIALAAGGVAAGAARAGPAVRAAAAAAGTLLLAAMAAGTWQRCAVFHDKAALWRDAVCKSPGHWMPQWHLAFELHRRRQFAEAVPHYEAALRLRPIEAGVRGGLANALFELGRGEEGLVVLREGIAAYPQAADLRFHRAQFLARLGRRDEAIFEYKETLRLKDDFAEARNNLATLLMQAGRHDDALALLDRLVEQKPAWFEGHAQRAAALEALGRPDEAAAEYRRALSVRPVDAAARMSLADLLLKHGRPGDAADVYREWLRIEPGAVEALGRLAWLYATDPDPAARNGPEAIRLATRLCDLTQHRQPRALDCLAAAYAESGDFDRAVETARRALEAARAAGLKAMIPAFQQRVRRYERREHYRERRNPTPDSQHPPP